MMEFKFGLVGDQQDLEVVQHLQKQVRQQTIQISVCFQADSFEEAVVLIRKSIGILDGLQVRQVLKTLEVQLRSLLGLAYYHRDGSIEGALAEFEKCRCLDPLNPVTWRRRAEVLLQNKDYPGALRNLAQYQNFHPDDREVRRLIKQIQQIIGAQQEKKVVQASTSSSSLVRFGSFEVIQITPEISDEVDARILKGVSGLSLKSKKSILKDSSSVTSHNTEDQKIDGAEEGFQYTKIKSIEKVSKKLEQPEQEDQEMVVYPLKKAKSMVEKDSESKECDIEPTVQSAKLKKKTSFKKSKSVSFRTLEDQPEES